VAKLPQSIRIVIDRKFRSIQVSEDILIHELQPYHSPQDGYFLNFSLWLKFGEYELNIKKCKLYLKNEGYVWKFPSKMAVPAIETNIKLYSLIMETLMSQKWIKIVGRNKLAHKAAPVKMEDFESIFVT
jgi:hypothetical protein